MTHRVALLAGDGVGPEVVAEARKAVDALGVPIEWTDLPDALRRHLFLRARERAVSDDDLLALKAWRESAPDAPGGDWFKDFGSFKICGEGKYPKTFLLAGQPAKGKKL